MLTWPNPSSTPSRARMRLASTRSSRAWETSCTLVEAVQSARVVVRDLLVQRRVDLAAFAQVAQRLNLGRLVAVAVIGADDQPILAGIALGDVIHVVVRLAGDPDAPRLQRVGWPG